MKESILSKKRKKKFMVVGSVLPKHAQKVLSDNVTAAGAREQTNVGTFANTLRARALSSGCVQMDAMFDAAGRKYNLSPDLLKAVAKVESNFRPNLTSRVGAMGVMQIMPGTARYLGVDDPFDAEQSIMGGARYLREQLDRFNGDIKLALAAYNAGWPAVVKHGGIPPFRETQAYVPKVLGHLGSIEPTASMLTYSGFSSEGLFNNSSLHSPGNSGFNFSEALAQMLFAKVIDMQMSSSDSSSNRVF